MGRSPFRKAGRSLEHGVEIGINEALIGVGIVIGSILVWGAWNWLSSKW